MFSVFGSNKGDDLIGSSSVISLLKRIPGLWVFWAHGWRWSCFQLSLFDEIVVPISIKSKNGLPLDGRIGTFKLSSEVKEFSVYEISLTMVSDSSIFDPSSSWAVQVWAAWVVWKLAWDHGTLRDHLFAGSSLNWALAHAVFCA